MLQDQLESQGTGSPDRNGKTSGAKGRGRNFERFVAAHTGLLRKYMAGQISGSSVGLEDALQEGLMRIWREWDGWPADEQEQLRYAQRALKCAAVDAIRREHGRDGNRPATIPVDFQLAEAGGGVENGQISDTALAAVGLTLAEQAAERRDDDRFVERGVLVGALVALSPLERRVVWELAREGRSYDEVAAELQIKVAKVRDTFFEARQLLRSLIAHADGSSVPRGERAQLFALLDGELKGRDKRIAQRHLDNCAACQRLADIERHVTAAGAHVFLPLPLALAGVWHGGKAAGLIGTPFTAPAPVAGSGGAGGLLGLVGTSAGAKFAIGLTAVTLVGSGGVASVLSEKDKAPTGDAVAAALPPSGTSDVAEPDRTQAVTAISAPKAKAKPRASRKHRRAHKTKHRAVRHHKAAAKKSAGSTLPSPAPSATPAPAAPAPRTGSGGGGGGSGGGEFLLGQ
jgi:RNA polymerase sigma factor (sigma-70 family)